jgi:hypothetical protein
VVFEAWVVFEAAGGLCGRVVFDSFETFDFAGQLVDFVARVVFDSAGGL